VAAPSLEAGLLHPVGLALPERRFHALSHVERYRSHAADALLGGVVPLKWSRSRIRDLSPMPIESNRS
jgi:hypothetical protein